MAARGAAERRASTSPPSPISPAVGRRPLTASRDGGSLGGRWLGPAALSPGTQRAAGACGEQACETRCVGALGRPLDRNVGGKPGSSLILTDISGSMLPRPMVRWWGPDRARPVPATLGVPGTDASPLRPGEAGPWLCPSRLLGRQGPPTWAGGLAEALEGQWPVCPGRGLEGDRGRGAMGCSGA